MTTNTTHPDPTDNRYSGPICGYGGLIDWVQFAASDIRNHLDNH